MDAVDGRDLNQSKRANRRREQCARRRANAEPYTDAPMTARRRRLSHTKCVNINGLHARQQSALPRPLPLEPDRTAMLHKFEEFPLDRSRSLARRERSVDQPVKCTVNAIAMYPSVDEIKRILSLAFV